MSKFNFGDAVDIKACVSFRYPDFTEKASNYKGKYRGEVSHKGIVLRKTRRATGFYNKGSTGRSGWDWDEAEPPTLTIDEWHAVYEVAIHPHGRLLFVEEEDMEIFSRSCV